MTPPQAPATALGDRAVDASVLIVLADIGRLDLLTLGDRGVLTADTVFQEVLAGGAVSAARRALLGSEAASPFGVRRPDVPAPNPLAAYMQQIALDAGEAATLALALTHALPAVLDDKAGRRAALALGIPFTGAAGVILEARRNGLIPSAADLLRQARQTGWFAPPARLLTPQLAALGETWP